MERMENELSIGATVVYRLDKGSFDKEQARWSNTVYEIVGIDGYRVRIRSKNGYMLYKSPNNIKLFETTTTNASPGKNQIFEIEKILNHNKYDMVSTNILSNGLIMMNQHGNSRLISD
ncbi:unnamed protein product [Phytophthora fragariaefolia]|uniref:Unnamed protein product n=1 Tax=Phytophthora fragariaefolia TaxID=1490495 RepID=A0A9W6Y8B7_9STRA|nr:unnamed protein product [Phytophthora fragariaefolia]